MIVALIVTALIVFGGSSFAFKDSDLDGVEDSVDRCPNTPILVLVDKHGCPLKRERLYIRIGTGFLKDSREERSYLLTSLAYALGGFYTSFTVRYYNYSKLHGSGMGDSTLFLGHSTYVGKLYLLPGIRIKIPTGDKPFSTGELDFTPSFVMDYLFGKNDAFLYSSYTFRGDKRYKNTFTISAGVGREFGDALYASISYDLSESAIRKGYNRYFSLFILYDLTRSLYTTLSYSKGINKEAVDHSATVRLGIRF